MMNATGASPQQLDFPKPENDSQRIEFLKKLNLLDSANEKVFDDLTFLAAHICETPISLVSLLDNDRQWFKSKYGLSVEETPRSVAFCNYAILEPDEVFVVEDAHADERFAENPLVTGNPHIRFYAGAPLVTQNGLALGTLCVIDREPRELDEQQMNALRALRRSVLAEIESRYNAKQLSQLFERQSALAEIELTINKPQELSALLDAIVDTTTRLLPAGGGSSIILWQPESKSFTVSASTVSNQSPGFATSRVRKEKGATRWILEQKKPMVVSDIRNDPFTANRMLVESNLKAYAGVPLLVEGNAIGVLYALENEPRSFEQVDIDFMISLANRASAAIEKVQLFEDIQLRSIMDDLTGVFNRRHFFEKAEVEFQRARRYQHPISIIILDIDHFKRFNDRFGHIHGDHALKTVAKTIQDEIRSPDLLSRYGGEEFCILLPETELDGASAFAERIRKKVAGILLDVDGSQESLTISLGVSTLDPSTPNLIELLDQADDALYRAKRAGRNRVQTVEIT